MTADDGLERYYVATCEGALSASVNGSKVVGMSAYVIDRRQCRRVMATFRSETQRANRVTHEGRRAQVLHLAGLEAARLNRLHVHSERPPAPRQ